MKSNHLKWLFYYSFLKRVLTLFVHNGALKSQADFVQDWDLTFVPVMQRFVRFMQGLCSCGLKTKAFTHFVDIMSGSSPPRDEMAVWLHSKASEEAYPSPHLPCCGSSDWREEIVGVNVVSVHVSPIAAAFTGQAFICIRLPPPHMKPVHLLLFRHCFLSRLCVCVPHALILHVT